MGVQKVRKTIPLSNNCLNTNKTPVKWQMDISNLNGQESIRRKWVNVPWYDKTNKMSVPPAMTQISLGIHPVWTESSLCAQFVAKDQRLLHADSPGWSLSSLGTPSFCWFSRVMSHMCILTSTSWIYSSRPSSCGYVPWGYACSWTRYLYTSCTARGTCRERK